MTQPLRIICLLAYFTCVGSFIWGMSGSFFRRVDRAGWGFRSIQMGGAVAFIWNTWALLRHERIELFSGLAALALYGASLLGFWWSVGAYSKSPPSHAFSADRPVALVQSGPYRLIRHPFYTSYLLTWCAGLVATHEVTLLIPLGLMIGIYAYAARLEEQKFASSALSNQYAAYRARTGMFLPWL
jgi:protein-S-isoprenylcysteine O-methyltransferase Ste14